MQRGYPECEEAERVCSDTLSSIDLLNQEMEFLSEQELEAGPTYASEGGESGTGKGTSSSRVAADTYSTPTEKGGHALIFQSRRQQEESSKEVSASTYYLRSHALGKNNVGFATMV